MTWVPTSTIVQAKAEELLALIDGARYVRPVSRLVVTPDGLDSLVRFGRDYQFERDMARLGAVSSPDPLTHPVGPCGIPVRVDYADPVELGDDEALLDFRYPDL